MFETGVDITSIKEIKKKYNNRLVERILSTSEMAVFNLITDDNRKYTYLAGRFAAKEALFKAFKVGDKTANYRDFSVLNDSNGAPYFEACQYLTNYEVKLSISHTNEYAVAFVILIKNW